MILGQPVLEIYYCLTLVRTTTTTPADGPYDPLGVLPKNGKRQTICVNEELIGTHGRAIEWVHPRLPRPSPPEKSPFEIAAKRLEVDLMCL